MYIIGGKFKKRLLTTPKTDKVRPTTSQLRETLFNICQLTIEDCRFLDLFAGSGAIGLEALSRGAAHATFVENNRQALIAIKKNIASLEVEDKTTVYSGDVLKALHHFYSKKETFDIIYADPPYDEGLSMPLLQFLDTHPLLADDGFLFIEDAALPPLTLNQLQLLSTRKAGRAFLHQFSTHEQ